MITHFVKHGSKPVDGLLPVCGLRQSRGNSGTYWASVNASCRLFLFVRDTGNAELCLLNRDTGRFVTLCPMEKHRSGWRGMFGWMFFQAKKSPVDEGPEYVLYYSSQW